MNNIPNWFDEKEFPGHINQISFPEHPPKTIDNIRLQSLTPFVSCTKSEKITIRQWAEIIEVTGIRKIKLEDWDSCQNGWTLFQLEPEFYPEQDLLLYARIGCRLIPVLLRSNGHALVYGVTNCIDKLVKFSITYSISFGCRVSLLNGFGAFNTNFRYPSASKHNDIVVLSGVITSSNKTVSRNGIILVSRLPITYYPEYDCSFLCPGLDRMYQITVTSNGYILLHIDPSLSTTMAIVSLDPISYNAYNSLPPLSLGLECDYTVMRLPMFPTLHIDKCHQLASQVLTTVVNCGLVFLHGILTITEEILAKSNLITILPENCRPWCRTVRIVPVSYQGKTYVVRLVITPDGEIRIQDALPIKAQVIFHVDFHYFIK